MSFPLSRYKYIKAFTFRKVPIYLHWSCYGLLLLSVLLIFKSGFSFFFLYSALVCLMLWHEAGHAYLAKKHHCAVDYIELFIIFGRCAHREAETLKKNYAIAWGGVLFQFVLFVPVFAYVIIFGLSENYNYINIFLGIFGYYNLLMIVFNLMPFPFLDGNTAWRIIPFWLRSNKAKSYLIKKSMIKKLRSKKTHLKAIK